MREAVLITSALLLAAPAGAGAKGTVSHKGEVYKVVDAFAYEGRAAFGEATAIKVRLSERPLDHKRLASAIDFAAELERQGGGDSFVELEFSMGGAWLGSSYQLKDSVCGFCADVRASAKSQVRVEGRSLKGALRVVPADYRDKDGAAIDVSLALTIATPAETSLLPADGGEVGKAFRACWQLVRGKNVAGVRQSCFPPDDGQLSGTEGSTGDGFWVVALWNRESLKLSALRISGGRRKGDWAELFVTGRDEQNRERKGSVFLRHGPGGWRFDHERLE